MRIAYDAKEMHKSPESRVQSIVSQTYADDEVLSPFLFAGNYDEMQIMPTTAARFGLRFNQIR